MVDTTIGFLEEISKPRLRRKLRETLECRGIANSQWSWAGQWHQGGQEELSESCSGFWTLHWTTEGVLRVTQADYVFGHLD